MVDEAILVSLIVAPKRLPIVREDFAGFLESFLARTVSLPDKLVINMLSPPDVMNDPVLLSCVEMVFNDPLD